MKPSKLIIIAFLFFAAHDFVQAQEPMRAERAAFPARVVIYAKTHKELLLADTILILAESADAASSVHCQKVAPTGCVERNIILSHHPNEVDTWSVALGMNAGMLIALNHLIWKFAPAPELRHMVWFTTGPIALVESINVDDNAATAARLQQARARVMR
jgi:hypothetical protein